MTAISALLLAAGESRRMGGLNKLLLPVAGKPLLRHTLDILAAVDPAEIVVVLGHQCERASAQLQGAEVKIVVNARYREGQMTSVEAGLGALSLPCDGVMVCLCDQPLLTVDDLKRLMSAFTILGDRSILVPTYQGQRGNPVIFSHRHREWILNGRNLGCRHLIERCADQVVTVEMDSDHVIADVDTQEDYRRILERVGRRRPCSALISNAG